MAEFANQIAYARACVIKQALTMHVRTGGTMMLTRGAKPVAMLKAATEYTGNVYKRGEYQRAIDDLQTMITAAQQPKAA